MGHPLTTPGLRDATPADLDAIVAIYNQTIPSRIATADLDPVHPEQRAAWLADHRPDHHPIWVAEHDGAIAGWLSIGQFRDRVAYDATAEVSVYVDAGRRRAGIGAMLLDEAVRRAPQLGLEVLVGLIFAHNQPSLALFERAGFARWGLLPGVCRLDDRVADVVIAGRATSS
jgi:L-amino acid N-acyltransferase YncA